MADRLREVYGVETELVRGARGIFEVSVDGEVVARKERGSFPTEEACVEAVGQALGRA